MFKWLKRNIILLYENFIIDKPSNATDILWNKEEELNNYNFDSDAAVSYLYNQQLFVEDQTSEWAKTANDNYKVSGETIAEIVMNKRNWKRGDLNNGWNSLFINGNPICKKEHLFVKLNKEWNGSTISWKYNTYVINI